MELARADSQRRSDTAVGHAPNRTAGSTPLPDLERVIDEAARGLGGLQRDDGHWLFELEADATIPAEYVLLNHFLDELDPETEARLGVYIRARQAESRRLAPLPWRRLRPELHRQGLLPRSS